MITVLHFTPLNINEKIDICLLNSDYIPSFTLRNHIPAYSRLLFIVNWV